MIFCDYSNTTNVVKNKDVLNKVDMIFCDYSDKDGVKNKEVQKQRSRTMYVIHYTRGKQIRNTSAHIYVHTYIYMNLDLL